MSTTPPEARRLLATLALILAAGGLTACSNGAAPAPSAEPTRHHQEQHPRRSEPLPQARHQKFAVPADVAGELQDVLTQRARAVAAHDRSTFDAGISDDPGFRSAQDTYY